MSLLQPNLSPFSGVNIIYSDHALEETDERLFAESRHRSERVRKKLIQRFGGEFRKVPCVFKTPQGLIAHPAMRSQIEKAFQ